MANKPLDGTAESDKMLKAASQEDRKKQAKDHFILPSGASLTFGPGASRDGITVIITPEPCIYCGLYPQSPDHEPYCGSECAAIAAKE